MIPIYRTVTGSGNTAVYTIVKWAGVRLMEVAMESGDKHILVQPANVITKGTIAADSGEPSLLIAAIGELMAVKDESYVAANRVTSEQPPTKVI